MLRFKIGDRVVIVGAAALFHPNNTGVVTAVKAQERPAFDEYVVELSDGSQATLWGFQLVPGSLEYQDQIARIVPEGLPDQPAPHVVRGGAPVVRQLVFQTQPVDLHVTISGPIHERKIVGQVLEKNTAEFVSPIEVSLYQNGWKLTAVTTDEVGVFTFERVPKGFVMIEVLLPTRGWRILASFEH